MRRFVKFLLCAFITVILVAAGAALSDSKLAAMIKPTVFETGNYGDYHYLQLNTVQKQAYTAIREKIAEFPHSIEIPVMESDLLVETLGALICDDPCLFMLNQTNTVTRGRKAYIMPVYEYSQEIYRQYMQQLNEIAAQITSQLPSDEYSRLIYLHDAIVNCCTYSDTNINNEDNIIGVLIDKKAKCTGYSQTLKFLLDKAGMDCVSITGVAASIGDEPVNHMWNAVRVNGSWCYVDATWDDPVSENGEELCRKIYFGMSEEMLRKTHSEFTFAFDASCSDNYYYNVINSYFTQYGNSTRQAMAKTIAANAARGENSAEFMFSSREAYSRAVADLFDSENIYNVLENAARETAGIVTNKLKYILDDENCLIKILLQ